MKKILILAQHSGDVYKLRKELLKELLKKGYEIFFCAPKDETQKEIEEDGCNFIDIEFDRKGMNPIKDIYLIYKYKKIIKKVKPDVVLTYAIKSNIYGGIACRIMKVKYIANITGLGQIFQKDDFAQKVVVFLYKIAFKKINCIFFQNSSNLDLFKRKVISKQDYELIPGSGINLKEYILEDYPVKNGKMEFLFIARVMKSKGIEEYITTAKYIKNKYNNIIFNVLGRCEEEYKDVLDELTKKEIINYHGMQKDVKSFIKNSVCIIHPSFYPEGMSNVILEGAASGRPVITTDMPGCKEGVEDKVTGYIIKPKDSKDLIEKVELFINLEYEQKVEMGKNGRLKMEKEFDRNIVIEKYMKVIN